MSLPIGYEIREMPADELEAFSRLRREIFEESQIFPAPRYLDENEKVKAAELAKLMGDRYRLRLGLYFENTLVGWAVGDQESSETFYMRNSAVLPAHRRKGLYTALMNRVIETVVEKGFQRVYSRHSATNNNVLIPKLKAGFVISSFEISDVFGVLVHLVYFPKNLRRKMMVYRVGDMKPDDEIRECLKI